MLVDDNSAFLDAASRFLSSLARVDIVARVTCAAEALAQFAALKPDLILMDVAMPGMSGLEALGLIKQTAMSVLAKCGARAVKPLLDALDAVPDATPEVRGAMTDALGRLGKDAIAPLTAIVGAKKDGPMLIAAVEALGKIGTPASDVTPLLMSLITTVPANLNPPVPVVSVSKKAVVPAPVPNAPPVLPP